MTPHPVPEISTRQVAAALAIGSIGVLMVGVQPILLGELVDAKQVSLEGVGIVAMAEIVTLGLGVVLGDAFLPWSRLRWITVIAALVAAALDLLTMRASGDASMTAVRAAAGLAEGVLIWGTTGVVVRTTNPVRIAGVFFVAQTIAQAAFGVLLARVVIPQGGWQGGFATLAALTLLPCLLAFAQPARLAPLAPATVSGFRWSAATVLPLAVVFLQLATVGSFWAYLEPLGQAAGFDGPAAQTLIAGVLATQVLGGSIASFAVRRVGVMPALLTSSVVLAVVMLTLYRLAPGSTLNFALGCAAFGFVWLFILPFHIGLAFRVDASGRLAGLVPAAQLLGSAFGPLTASFIVDGENAAAVPLLSAGFAVASGLLLWATRRRTERAVVLSGAR